MAGAEEPEHVAGDVVVVGDRDCLVGADLAVQADAGGAGRRVEGAVQVVEGVELHAGGGVALGAVAGDVDGPAQGQSLISVVGGEGGCDRVVRARAGGLVVQLDAVGERQRGVGRRPGEDGQFGQQRGAGGLADRVGDLAVGVQRGEDADLVGVVVVERHGFSLVLGGCLR
ncbi:hypothetical protein [Streptomyces sp. NPDC007205]|uniref:hypothetical protein n=1 Tax=Streptomyces sp. NPDC007205 TaxID=3154316 RepID=UPI0033C9822D